MTDPVSVAGLLIAIGGLVQTLVTYASDAKDARDEIVDLTTEIFALKSVLEHVEYQQHAPSSDLNPDAAAKYDSQEFSRILESTKELLDSLSTSIKPVQTRFGQSVQRLTWPLKRDEVQRKIMRIERAKTWLSVVLTSNNLSYLQHILLEISQLSKILQDEQEQKGAGKANLLHWLAPIGPEPAHFKALKTHVQGTSEWFLNGPLKQFLDSSRAHREGGEVLWLRGKSGSGKTTLIAYVVEHLKTISMSTQDTGTAYFYCSFSDLASQDPINILGSLAAQLTPKSPQMLEEYMIKFKEEQKMRLPRSVSLWDIMGPFIRHTACFSRVFVCVDAVNESEKTNEIVTALFQLAGECENLFILISSTRSYRNHSDRTHFSIAEIDMCAEKVDEDVRLYIGKALTEDENLKKFSETLKTDVESAILTRSNGMFRYAHWQMEHLAAQRTGRGARKALSDMPQNLNESYERVLSRIPRSSPDRLLIRQTLHWLCFATRPLRLLELGDAVVLEDGDEDLDEDSKLHSPEVLIELAQGLLEHDVGTTIVSLAHFSIKTFLTSAWIRQSAVADFAVDESEAHRMVMRKCLTYLRFPMFKVGASQPDPVSFVAGRYPLMEYAAQNWCHHIKAIDLEDWSHISALLSTRTLPDGGNYGWWIQCVAKLLPPEIIQDTSPLYYAASFGYVNLVKAILEFDQTVDLEAPGGRVGSTALQVACFRKQWEVSKLLVQAGADPYSPDGSGVEGGLTSFFWAESNGWEDIMELMTKTQRGRAHQPTYTPDSVTYAQEVQKRATQAFNTSLSVRQSQEPSVETNQNV